MSVKVDATNCSLPPTISHDRIKLLLSSFYYSSEQYIRKNDRYQNEWKTKLANLRIS